jgi:hypothetical protein
MPPLQIREVPRELYAEIQSLAKSENRSINQQALTLIQEALAARIAGAASLDLRELKLRKLWAAHDARLPLRIKDPE